jgi:phosphohistidine phosphatase
MLLHVMRHGSAEDRASSGRDGDRALTEEGRDRVAQVAAELRRQREDLLLLLTGSASAALWLRGLRVLASPVRRARETAEIAAAVLGSEVELSEELDLDAGPPLSLAAELASLGEDALLVGHQPNVEHLVRSIASHVTLPGGFCTAMVVTLKASAGGFQVRAVIDPRRLP